MADHPCTVRAFQEVRRQRIGVAAHCHQGQKLSETARSYQARQCHQEDQIRTAMKEKLNIDL